MSAPRKNAANTRGRPFAKGNPGRPKGARHRVTLAIEALLEGEHEELTRKAIDLAKNGDIPALRLCLERLSPPRKDAPIALDLPPLRTAADALNASSIVLEAVGCGDITPDEASRLMGLLTAHRSIVETVDLEERISKLESERK